MWYKAFKDPHHFYKLHSDNGATVRIVRIDENSSAWNIWKEDFKEKFYPIELDYAETKQAISYITRNYDVRLKWLLQELMERPWNGKEYPYNEVVSQKVKDLLKSIYL